MGLASLLRSQGQLAAARQALAEAVRTSPQSSQAWQMLAELLKELKETPAAVRC